MRGVFTENIHIFTDFCCRYTSNGLFLYNLPKSAYAKHREEEVKL
jgi:hypothetical protein